MHNISIAQIAGHFYFSIECKEDSQKLNQTEFEACMREHRHLISLMI